MGDKTEKKLTMLFNKAMIVGNVNELKSINDEMKKGIDFLTLSTGRFVAEFGAHVPINTKFKSTKLIGKAVSEMMKKRSAEKINPTETSTPMSLEAQRLYSFFHEQMSLVRLSIAAAEKK